MTIIIYTVSSNCDTATSISGLQTTLKDCVPNLYFLCFLLQKVLHKICSTHGKVLRIVIFHKNGLQALVEYPFKHVFRNASKMQGPFYLKI